MKVAELISLLEAMNPDAEVAVCVGASEVYPEFVDDLGDKVVLS